MSTKEKTMITEQLINLKCLIRFGKISLQAREMLHLEYGVNIMSCTCVFEWQRRFKEGSNSVKDESLSWRPFAHKTECTVTDQMDSCNIHGLYRGSNGSFFCNSPKDICLTTTTITTSTHRHLYQPVANGFMRVALCLECLSDLVITSPWVEVTNTKSQLMQKFIHFHSFQWLLRREKTMWKWPILVCSCKSLFISTVFSSRREGRNTCEVDRLS